LNLVSFGQIGGWGVFRVIKSERTDHDFFATIFQFYHVARKNTTVRTLVPCSRVNVSRQNHTFIVFFVDVRCSQGACLDILAPSRAVDDDVMISTTTVWFVDLCLFKDIDGVSDVFCKRCGYLVVRSPLIHEVNSKITPLLKSFIVFYPPFSGLRKFTFEIRSNHSLLVICGDDMEAFLAGSFYPPYSLPHAFWCDQNANALN